MYWIPQRERIIDNNARNNHMGQPLCPIAPNRLWLMHYLISCGAHKYMFTHLKDSINTKISLENGLELHKGRYRPENFFYWKGWQALEQAIQGSCGGTIPGGIKRHVNVLLTDIV